MTIECYFSNCFFHGSNQSPYEDGPFCYEDECRASEEQIIIFAKARKEWLKNVSKDPKRPPPTSDA